MFLACFLYNLMHKILFPPNILANAHQEEFSYLLCDIQTYYKLLHHQVYLNNTNISVCELNTFISEFFVHTYTR